MGQRVLGSGHDKAGTPDWGARSTRIVGPYQWPVTANHPCPGEVTKIMGAMQGCGKVTVARMNARVRFTHLLIPTFFCGL